MPTHRLGLATAGSTAPETLIIRVDNGIRHWQGTPAEMVWAKCTYLPAMNPAPARVPIIVVNGR